MNWYSPGTLTSTCFPEQASKLPLSPTHFLSPTPLLSLFFQHSSCSKSNEMSSLPREQRREGGSKKGWEQGSEEALGSKGALGMETRAQGTTIRFFQLQRATPAASSFIQLGRGLEQLGCKFRIGDFCSFSGKKMRQQARPWIETRGTSMQAAGKTLPPPAL